MADQKIPYEFQSDFGQAAELDRIAQLMQQQRLLNARNAQPQMVSGHYIRMSPMQGLADLFAAYQGGKASSQAAALRQRTTDKMAADERSQFAKIAELMLGRPEMQEPTPEGGFGPGDARQLPAVEANPLAASRFAMGSQYPRVQDFGKGLSETVRNQTSAFAPRLRSEALDTMARTGAAPAGGFKPDERWSPVENLAPPGQPPMLGARRLDTNEPKFAPQGTNITTNVGARGTVDALQDAHKYFLSKEFKDRVKNVRTSLEASQVAWKLIDEGAINTGTESGIKTFAQKLAGVLGLTVDPRAPATELYNSFIVPQLGNIITMFGAGTGLSDSDRKAALEALAQAKNDPRMIQVALAFAARGAVRELQSMNEESNRYKGIAAESGLFDPNFFPKIEYKFQMPQNASRELPNNIFEPGALEDWAMKKLYTGAPAPKPSGSTPGAEEAAGRWLPKTR